MAVRTRTTRGTTFGGFAFAALLVMVLSGVALVLPFDAHKPYESIALFLLTSPGARFYRNVHYFAAQLFLLLTILHAWDHLRRSTERRLSSAMWMRVTMSIPVAAFVMLSGFMLKGDPEAVQALRIVTTAIGRIPLAGRFVSAALFGPPSNGFQVVYAHHAATATIFIWLFVAEHARSVWPRLFPVVLLSLPVAAVSLLFAPVLHDGFDPLVQGPWYFLGLQELLHWTAQPSWVVAAAALAVVVVLLLPRLKETWARRAKRMLAVAVVAYALLTVFALCFRGENWALAWPRPGHAYGIAFQPALAVPSAGVAAARAMPVVLGRPEGCLFCHDRIRGLSASHRADAIGCSSCHGGDPFSLDKQLAHRRMILVPGNLDVAARTCGLPQCHPGIVERVQKSVMTTLAGIISVDRSVFGETGAGVARVSALGGSPADSHVRQLCASCHLGSAKRAFGPVGESSRGGGCNACHLNYSREAREELARYERNKRSGAGRVQPDVHPDVSIDIGDDHCFGCHSRSGRISTSYEGWMEQDPGVVAARGFSAASRRALDDGRSFEHARADIHFEKGMRCVDCHTAREVMGDGTAHGRKSEQVRVACEDCHPAAQPRIARVEAVDTESQRVLRLRNRLHSGEQVLMSARGDALVNTTIGAAGEMHLVASGSNQVLPLKRAAPVCVQDGGHARLSCISCHAAWAPRCSGCHTRFDGRATAYDHVAEREVRGAWVEEGSDYRALPPTLGVRTTAHGDGTTHETIDTFVPGMILTIDPNTTPGHRADTIFRRLYARTFSHTVSKGSRSCESCHSDPVALGYGRGTLRFEHRANGGTWSFVSEQQASAYDRLPADAWVGFLQTRRDIVSTRADVRPFTVDEQKRILTVGACLTCHRGDSAVMRDAVADFKAALRGVSKRCVLPVWE